MKDQELHPWLEQLIRGDSDAFTPIYELTSDHVYRTVYCLLGDKTDTADVVSEIYLEFMKSIGSYSFELPFRSWLNGLIIRQTNNWRRKIWRRVRITERVKQYFTESSPIQSEEQYVKREQRDELLAMVNKLPYKLKQVIVLKHFQECSYEEMASLLNVPLGTVKSRHHSAIGKLRRLTEHQMNNKEVAIRVDREQTDRGL
ncbi:MAG: sigma-70 family RNA polymerase sigma factor [Candidatus Pristimantibacillus sp.]